MVTSMAAIDRAGARPATGVPFEQTKRTAAGAAPAAPTETAPAPGATPTAASARAARAAFAVDPAAARLAGAVATATRRAPGPPYGSAAFEAKLDRETGSVARPDNRATLLFDGVNSFAERKKLIEGAKDSIHLQTFIFTADDTGWELARSLAKKAQEGVDVRVIYDGVGSNRAEGSGIFEFMRKNGVEVKEYGDPLRQFWDLNNRWHEKHLIVDGKASIEGGMNIADEYALGGSGKLVFSRGNKQGDTPWRDADVKIEGPAVHDAQRAFLKNWESVGGKVSEADRRSLFPTPERTPGGAKVRVVQHRPDEDGDENTGKLYLNAIRSAEKSITIENAYFVPPKELRNELIAAAKRGVDVKVMTNSRATNDTGVVSDASRYYYDDLVKAGVKIYERQTSTLHSKTATFDGKFSIVGSTNLNGRSDGLDSEAALAVTDGATARSLERRFAEGLPEAKAITTQELKKEGFFTNLKQWALSLFSWTF